MHNHLNDKGELNSGTIKEISLRYRGRWLQGYVRGKLRSDPVYLETIGVVGAFPAPVLDIGCGPGLLAHCLNACGVDVPYTGLDADSRKISSAKESIRELASVRFEHADCLLLPDWQGHVALLDVLHYLDAETQMRLLDEAIPRIAPGASLIIRTVLRDRSWRFRATQAEELFIRGSRWIRGGVKHYPRAEELLSPLRDAGLSVAMPSLFGHTPFNSFLVRATRLP